VYESIKNKAGGGGTQNQLAEADHGKEDPSLKEIRRNKRPQTGEDRHSEGTTPWFKDHSGRHKNHDR
jgi:hypothetical protein